jgi:hypothetical protein
MGPTCARRLCAALLVLGCARSGSPTRDAALDSATADAGAPGASDAPPVSDAPVGPTGDGPTSDGPAPSAGDASAGEVSASCAPLLAPTTRDDPTDMPAADPALATQQHRFFRITVKDSATAAPIPGATLSTVTKIALTTDVNGVVAFYEPGLMGM